MSVKSQLVETCERSSVSYLPDGYIMLKALKVSNFRCFKEVDISNLRRINVIVGKNAAGKTALLEAIKVGLDGLPSSLPWLNGQRNIPMLLAGTNALTADQFEGLFRDFFFGFDTHAPIEFWMQNSSQESASLRVYFDANRPTTVQMSIGFQQEMSSARPPTTIIPLAFERVDFQGQKSTISITVTPQGQFLFEPGKPLGEVSGFFSNINFGNPPESAAWLSNLSVDKRSEEVIKAVRRHFPFVHQLTSETPILGLGGTVYADVPSLPKKLPLTLLSGGISRLFTLILAIVTYKGGVVFVDEIENGIFYDQYPMVWKTLTDLAEQNKTQLFISTHSNECLQALLPTIRGSEKDFVLLRAERENGASRIVQFTGAEFEGALAKGGEIRKP